MNFHVFSFCYSFFFFLGGGDDWEDLPHKAQKFSHISSNLNYLECEMLGHDSRAPYYCIH